MTEYPIELLLDALSSDGTCFILGAGCSSPHVPTMGELPQRVASYAPRLGSFGAGGFPDSPLRLLIAPIIENAQTTTGLDEWKAGAMTPASIAVVLEHLIATAHWLPLPQYAVFRLVPQNATIVSFNWDGLALARCHQSTVVHPHGIVRPRLLSSTELDDLLDDTQLYDAPDARELFIPGLVMPGEEGSPRLAAVREKLLHAWLKAPQVVIIGYSFGLASNLDYDRIWLDTFAEALRINTHAAIHVVAPNATWLRGELVEHLKRSVNVHAWPLNWYALSRALLSVAQQHGCVRLAELRVRAEEIGTRYRVAAEQPIAAV